MRERIVDIAHSVHGVSVRLTHERWYHIVENHDDLAGRFHDVLDAIESPAFVVRGNEGTLKAARNMARKKWLVVVYREVTRNDGFVITAYTLDGRPKGDIVWPRR